MKRKNDGQEGKKENVWKAKKHKTKQKKCQKRKQNEGMIKDGRDCTHKARDSKRNTHQEQKSKDDA